jgi:hypothetical protein
MGSDRVVVSQYKKSPSACDDAGIESNVFIVKKGTLG